MSQLSQKLKQCTGVVLCGGQSSRMGQDKALLTWQGKPLYQHMIEQLYAAGIDGVLLNGSHSFSHILNDIIPDRGPLSGLHAALHHRASGYLLIVPVDMPLLKPEDLTRLVQECDGERPLQYEGYSLPLLIPASDQARLFSEQAIRSENRRDYALWRLMEKLDGQTLPAPAGHEVSFSNTNTPQEWLACTDVSEALQTD